MTIDVPYDSNARTAIGVSPMWRRLKRRARRNAATGRAVGAVHHPGPNQVLFASDAYPAAFIR